MIKFKKKLNEKFPFDFYINYLLSKKVNKIIFLKFSEEVFAIIKILKKKKIRIIKSHFFGNIIVPNADNGRKTFYDLFAFHELSLFVQYYKLKKNFSFAIDVGANLGIHTIILTRLGYKVSAFEPDNSTFKKLKKTLKINKCKNFNLYNLALSDFIGKSKFYQIKDNLTANTLSNSTKKTYGNRKIINVNVSKISNFLPNKDILIKIDAEGSEFNILKTINWNKQYKISIYLEINDKESAEKIFNYLKLNKLKCRCEINNWKVAYNKNQLPNNWRQGSVLIQN